MLKKCVRCKQDKTTFYKNKTKKDGHDDHCKECRNEVGKPYRRAYSRHHYEDYLRKQREYCRKNADKHTVYRLNRRVGTCVITLEMYQSLRKVHDGLCDICRRPPITKRLTLDHDHKTGKVRGFLCGACNTGLGTFRDNTDFLQSAVRYLEKYGQEA